MPTTHGDQALKKLNGEFDEYRECLRVVWNLALRHRLKGTVAFPDVSQTLLDALVLDDLAGATPVNTVRTVIDLPGIGSASGWIPALGVVITSQAATLLIPQECAEAIEWTVVSVGTEAIGALFYYVDLFDFADADQMFDFEYVKAVAAAACGHLAEGSLVLLRRSDVDIVDLTDAG